MQHKIDSTPQSVLVPTRVVCQRYNVCSRTVHRWVHRPDLDFPRPVFINGRNYYALQKLEQWERQRAQPSARFKASKQAVA